MACCAVISDTNEPTTEMIFPLFTHCWTWSGGGTSRRRSDRQLVVVWKMENRKRRFARCCMPSIQAEGLWWLPTWSGRDVPFLLHIFFVQNDIEVCLPCSLGKTISYSLIHRPSEQRSSRAPRSPQRHSIEVIHRHYSLAKTTVRKLCDILFVNLSCSTSSKRLVALLGGL